MGIAVRGLPVGPTLAPDSVSQIFKLAREVKRLASLMTVGRDLHDIRTTLCLLTFWPYLTDHAQRYSVHRLRLLYVAVTKGWSAATYYDHQDGDEYLDVPPDF
jgi:hypothetical protein